MVFGPVGRLIAFRHVISTMGFGFLAAVFFLAIVTTLLVLI
jgi:hypothetical protein